MTSSGSSVTWKSAEIQLADRARREHRVAHPVQQPGPVRPADQDDRELPHLAGLDQRQRLEQLVERAETAGQDDEAVGVLHEHDLAGEEVAELDAEVDVGVRSPARAAARCCSRPTGPRPPGSRGWPPPSCPGPPPVMTANPASASRRPIARASSYVGSPGAVRAEPKTVIAGPTWASASNPSTNSERIRSVRHGSVSRKAGSRRRSRSFSSSVAPVCPPASAPRSASPTSGPPGAFRRPRSSIGVGCHPEVDMERRRGALMLLAIAAGRGRPRVDRPGPGDPAGFRIHGRTTSVGRSSACASSWPASSSAV